MCIALMYTSYVLHQRIKPFLVSRPLEGLGMSAEELIARVDEYNAGEALRRKAAREARKLTSTAKRRTRSPRTSTDLDQGRECTDTPDRVTHLPQTSMDAHVQPVPDDTAVR